MGPVEADRERRRLDDVKTVEPPSKHPGAKHLSMLHIQRTAGNRAAAQLIGAGRPIVVQRGIGSFFRGLFGKKAKSGGDGAGSGTSAVPEPIRVPTQPGGRQRSNATTTAPPRVDTAPPTVDTAPPTVDTAPPTVDTAPPTLEPSAIVGPTVVTISGERVAVSTSDEQTEAEQIINTMTTLYGMALDWSAARDAIIAQYGKVATTAHAGLLQGVWQMKELRALLAATSHFAPILGPSRETSAQKSRAQGVTTIGRLNDVFMTNTPTSVVEPGTMGEYFRGGKAVGLFDTVTDWADKRYVREGATAPDNATTLEANSIHEMSHGLIEPYAKGDWVAGLDFWDDAYTKSGEVGAEAPPTGYGRTSAGEDLAESFAIYFTNRPQLLSVAPRRAALIAAIIAAWTPVKKKKVVAASVEATGTGP